MQTPRTQSALLVTQAVVFATMVASASPRQAAAQDNTSEGSVPTSIVANVKTGGSSNIHLIAHVPLGGYFRVADGDIEQELSRPYAYFAQTRDQIGFTILDLHDLKNAKVIYRWRIGN